MTPAGLAWRNLAHKRGRTAVAAAGVAFAVVLVFMELGLYGGVGRTAAMLYGALRFDLLLISTEYVDVSRTGSFPRGRVAQARAVAGVADALPVSLGTGTWRLPARRTLIGTPVPAGGVRSINVLGVPPDRLADVFATERGRVFRSPDEAAVAAVALGGPDAALFDEHSKPEFGMLADLLTVPPDGDPETGTALRFNGRRVEVVGGFRLGTGFSWNAMLMTNEATFSQLTLQPADRVTFGLVTLEPGADPAAVAARLRAVLPPDVQVLSRAEVEAREERHWLRLTSIGQFLLVAVVLAQAAYLAVLGFAPGFAATFGLYALARNVGGIPTEMTAARAALVLALTVGMCLASGLLAVRKVHAADPADLFI